MKGWQEYTEELYKKDLNGGLGSHSFTVRHPGVRGQVGIRKQC